MAAKSPLLAVGCMLGMIAGGCAQGAEKIGSSYISPVAYQSYTCQQLSEEAQRVSARAAQAAGVQDEQATKDAVATGVAIVIFWPAAFFVSGGNGQNAAELARLRGQMQAIEEVNIQKRCGLKFQSAPPPEAAPKRERYRGPTEPA
jgi:hypothetical protein